ncbi:bromo adjacent-like domain-containing 1 protein-like [Scleropages formosus]|uniref:Bromo adjacent homology domain containing 1 n=1 Tax=Scleropages formosus TaxID=113540 RepID=A0A0P7UEP9_SCLFO|nr:bromo adjacent homology domain-containing 1 protein [Scleropages formosus]XP_018583368.1 bromo adjacent homology domain-containing 1 protein [Scleropages formosus]XP_018583369.1 bromo adjacent homology domain-containing 1 protein [Scleropages formosus]KPP68196.1 bromo adjacent-like domain-containing 1 protein-like [Scleropages formosus]
MTHARQKDTLNQYQTEGRDQLGDRLHGETMGGAWPECPLRTSRTRQGVAKRGGTKEIRELCLEKDRKLYPLRGRMGVSEVGTRNCHVLLTRLEASGVQSDEEQEKGLGVLSSSTEELKCRLGSRRTRQRNCNKSTQQACNTTLDPNAKSKLENPFPCPPGMEPRKRRVASLNAEAVNSLLLEREDPQQATRHAKKLQHPNGQYTLSGEAAKDPAGLRKIQDSQKCSEKSDSFRSPKPQKRAKIDSEGLKELSLDSPTPRRLAGLNAAALLKLTSTSAGAKRRLKTDNKEVCPGARGKQPHSKSRKQRHKLHSHLQLQPRGSCTLCKREALHPDVEWEGMAVQRGFNRSGYQCRTMLSYPLKPVKEEQTETEVNPYYCCAQDGIMDYHRLALFLGPQAYGEPEDHSPSAVKQEFHPQPHRLAHTAFATDSHSYPCLSCFYVHIPHQGAPLAPLSSSPVPFAPATLPPPIKLCSNGVPGSRLLTSTVSHPSGIPHPAFCNSVGSPCFGEAYRVSSYAYRAVPPLTNRRCSYHTSCSGCNHKIKTEDCSSLEDRSPSIPVSPALPLSGCPVPSVPPAGQSAPHLSTLLSDPSQPQVQLRVARECPQSAKPPSGSRSGVRSSASCPHLSDSQLAPSRSSGTANKQQKITRRRATNGWLPVGVPTEKEIFIVGEDVTALRRCYDGVQRDGEVIRVRDTVLLRSGPRKKSLPYVAKISALWEDPDTGEMMMSLFWYYRPEHTQGGRNSSMHCENEIFASRHQDENSVACIEDKCYVLTLAQYCRFCALVKRRGEGLPESAPLVPPSTEYTIPAHRRVPANIDPDLVFLCRHVYDFRYGRILKNLQ